MACSMPANRRELFGLEGFSANDFEKAITGLTLEPGVYHVNVEALRDIPELGDVEVRFDVHPPSRK